jgi:hypothetical protein
MATLIQRDNLAQLSSKCCGELVRCHSGAVSFLEYAREPDFLVRLAGGWMFIRRQAAGILRRAGLHCTANLAR